MTEPARFPAGPLGAACQELQDRLGKLFHAVDGPPRAYFELGCDLLSPAFRVVYSTWDAGYFGALSAPEMERAICERMFEDIVSLLDEREDAAGMVLFWRKRPQVSVELGPVQGPPNMLYVKVRMRFAIPNLDLTKAQSYRMEGRPIGSIEEPLDV